MATDTFGSSELVDQDDFLDVSGPDWGYVICIDSNDIPHVSWTGYDKEVTDERFGRLMYSNKIGGSWISPDPIVVFQSQEGNPLVAPYDIMCTTPNNAIGAERPIIAWTQREHPKDDPVEPQLRFISYGNALDATTFTDSNDLQIGITSMSILDSGKIIAISTTGPLIQSFEHDPTDIWTTWTATTLPDHSTSSPQATLATSKSFGEFIFLLDHLVLTPRCSI